MRETIRDLIVGARALWNDRGFAAVAIVALGLGIGANTAVFSVVEAMYNFPIPMRDVEQIAFVFATNEAQDIQQNTTSVDDFLDWATDAKSFSHFAAGAQRGYNLTGSGEPTSLQAFQISQAFLPMTGNPMALGREFLPEECLPGARRVAVLSFPSWQQHFGGSLDVLERSLVLDGEAYSIVGVTAEEFFFPTRQTALFTPLILEAGATRRDDRSILAMARLEDGVTPEAATAELQTVADRLNDAYPDTNEGWSAEVIRVRDNLIQGAALGMIVLYGSITFVLLIACVNVANLLLARASVREKEMALRTALGAGRARLIRQLLTEGLLLSVIGGSLGFLIGVWGMGVLKAMLAPDPNVGFLADEIGFNLPMLGHALFVSLGAALLFGMAPALKISRPDLRASLNESGRTGQTGRKLRLRSALIVSEVAMAIALLGTSGTLMRTFNHVYLAAPGFDSQNLLTLQLNIPEKDRPEDNDLVRFFDDGLKEISTIPGARTAAYTTNLPLTVFPGAALPPVQIEGYEMPDASNLDSMPRALVSTVSANFFETFGVPILSGRALHRNDIEESQRVAVVSQRMEERFFSEGGAIGRRLRMTEAPDAPWVTVVGVSGNVETTAHSIRNPQPMLSQVYLPLNQNPVRAIFMAVKTDVEPTTISPMVRQAIWNVSATQPIDLIRSMDEVIAQVDTQNRFFMRILTVLSAIALALAAVGIYGIIAFAVNQRRREIGIRMALGATRASIVSLVLRRGALLTMAGLALGLVGTRAFVRLLGAQLQAIGESGGGGPLTYLMVSMVLLGVAQLASYVPARRALNLDPVATLRNE